MALVAWHDPDTRAAVQRVRRLAWLGLAVSVLAGLGAMATGAGTRAAETTTADAPLWVVMAVRVLMVVAVYALIVSTVSLVRARRRHRILRAHPWRRVRVGLREIRTRTSTWVVLRVPLPDADAVVYLPNILRGAPARAGLRDGAEVEVAGDGSGPMVLRGPGSTRLLTAVPPRSPREERRWREAAGWPATPEGRSLGGSNR